MKHQGTKRLETGRLILRRFVIDDAEAMYNNWASDPEVSKYLTWPYHKTVEVSKNVLTDWTCRYSEDDYYQWAIVLKENGNEPIGSIAVVHKNDNLEMVHIGYCIGKRWWNKGIMSEALAALVRFFFEEVGVNRIEARHDTRNPNSGKVMMKCGLRHEGTFREADLNNQGICDSAMYAILYSDYKSEKQKG
ncbi:MAG: GNAT family N-acetyltransferase [Christensenellales bacterium]|jgi:ribosomal-protein-alanine N-acetyltransferase